MQDERIRALEAAIASLTQRVQALEAQGLGSPAGLSEAQRSDAGLSTGTTGTTADSPADDISASSSYALESPDSSQPGSTAPAASTRSNPLPLIGRTLLVLGGGFLLRAATESGALPVAGGAFIGFLYGLAFLVLAYRAAKDPNSHTSAQFHGFAASLVVFPLIWEATVQKGYLSVPLGGISLGIAVLLALLVAWRRGLRLVAWIFAPIGALMAFAMAWSTHWWAPLVSLSLLIAWATLLLFYLRGWSVLASLGAIFADAIILLLGTLFLMQSESPFLVGLGLDSLLGLQLLLVAVYMGTFAYRTLVRGVSIRTFEALQAVLVLAVGVGLALVMGRSNPQILIVLGWMSLLGAALSYGVSFAFIDRRGSRRSNFIFYTSIALALMMVMAITLAAGEVRTWLLMTASAVTLLLAVRHQRITLLLHATLFASAAALSSGLVALSLDALAGDAVQVSALQLLPLLVVLALLFVCAAVHVHAHQGTWGPMVQVPQMICLILMVIGGSGVLAALGETIIGGSGGADPGWVASMRTAVFSFFAVLMAWLAAWRRFRPAAWLVYPILVLGGFELVLGDFRLGRPVTMFVSFVFYGGALILTPLLIKRARAAAATEAVEA